MNKALLFRLVVPLTLLAAASLAANAKWSADGFFINLATELVGIGITVLYVDWILRKHEEGRWRGAAVRIGRRLQFLCNATVTGLRGALGFTPDILDRAIMMSGSVDAMNAENMRIGTQVLAPAVRNRLESLDQDGWKRLANHLQATSIEADQLLDRFGHKLEPKYIEILLDIQQAIHSALIFWRTFPDIAGVPPGKLPATKTPPEQLQSNGYDMTAKQIQEVLYGVQKLSSQLNGSLDA